MELIIVLFSLFSMFSVSSKCTFCFNFYRCLNGCINGMFVQQSVPVQPVSFTRLTLLILLIQYIQTLLNTGFYQLRILNSIKSFRVISNTIGDSCNDCDLHVEHFEIRICKMLILFFPNHLFISVLFGYYHVK